MKNVWKKRIAFLLTIVMIVSMMIVVNASPGDYNKWKEDYDTYGYDPYEEYYEAWGIPSVQTVYEERGEKAADAYIGHFRSNLQFDDAKEQMQDVAAKLDITFPKVVETADPTASWTAANDPYVDVYKSLGLPTFGEVERDMGRTWAIEWRKVSAGAETGVVKVQGIEYPVAQGLPFSYELLKGAYEASQTTPPEESQKPTGGVTGGSLTDDTGVHADGWYYDKNGNKIGYVAGVVDGYYVDEYGNRLGTVAGDKQGIGFQGGNQGGQGTTTQKPDDVQYFPDVTPDKWYYEAINAMAASGLLHGYEDGTFRPENPVTVGEWCTIIWNIVGQNIAPTAGTVYYQDAVSSHWASHAVWRCKENGYTNVRWTQDPEQQSVDIWDETIVVREAGTYDEDRLTLRGEAATAIIAILENDPDTKNWIAKLESRQKKIGEKNDWTLDQIPDANVIHKNVDRKDLCQQWDEDSIIEAYNLGILHGMDTAGTCNPYGTMTRAEACQMLYNALITGPHPLPGGNHGGITGG